MKKFLTVLLVIAVMFTFSFGSAFAVTNTEANLIKQSADYAKSLLPEAVAKAYTAVVKGGTANTYITTAAWEAAAADIVDALEEDIDLAMEEYLEKGVPADKTGWDAYDYVYAAGKLYAGYGYTDLAAAFAADTDASAVMAAKEQFEMDLASAMAVYDKIDFAGLYSTTTPKTGKTYYEQAVEKVEANKEALKAFYFAADGSVQSVGTSVSSVANEIAAIKGWIENGFDGAFKLTAVKAKVYEGTSVVEYYYVDGITTKAKEEAADATDAAKAAAAKAAAQAAYAKYLAENTADKEFSKDFAADWLQVVNYLADENEIDGSTVESLYNGLIYADGVKEEVAKYSDAIDNVAALKAYAAKCAAEKDATGAYVRDAEDIQDIVDEYTVAAYKYAAGLAAQAPDLAKAKGDVAVLSIDKAADKLAFDKEAEKADLADELDSIIDGYYDLEAEAVKAEYEKAYAAVDAAAKVADFVEIEAALDKAVGKILEDSEVEALFNGSAMNKELTAQVTALGHYLTYANSGVKDYADAHIEYDDNYLTTQVRDYYIASNARTAAEMKALTGVVEAVAATLPTNADLAAAKTAAEDAIKALPAIAKVTSADKDAFQNAFDLAKAYNKLVKAATGTAGTLKIDQAKIDALQKAIQEEFQLAYAKADKTDKAAMKAIAADVAAANKEVGSTKLFTSKFVNPAKSALDKIKVAEKAAVDKAINAIPFTLTEADKATVAKARELYDAYVAEYTDYDLGKADKDAGYVADDFDLNTLLRAEAALGLNAEDPAYSVESLKIKARTDKAKKGSITVRWTVVDGDDSAVEGYEIWKSTKHSSGYKKMVTKSADSDWYKNTKGLKKGTRYYYKVRAIAYTEDGVKVKSDFSNKARRIAK